MTLVRDVLYRDPSSWSIPNLGVAKVGQPRSEEEWAVLRYELGAFVAEGEYATGLERIMSGYLARLVLWLREEGIFAAVREHLAKSGRTLDSVLPHLYVSDHLASAILAAKPGFAATPADVRQLIKAQFPSVPSIDEHTFLDVLEETLRAVTPGGDIPLTLVVLDELQQFIGEDTDRAHEVQQIVESCCSRLRSRVLFVGTGQMALGATPTLQKLLDRYTVSVALQDRDLDRVVRSVVLRKRPDRASEVEEALD